MFNNVCYSSSAKVKSIHLCVLKSKYYENNRKQSLFHQVCVYEMKASLAVLVVKNQELPCSIPNGDSEDDFEPSPKPPK